MVDVERAIKARSALHKSINKLFGDVHNIVGATTGDADIELLISLRDTIIEKHNKVTVFDQQIFDSKLDNDGDVEAEETSTTNFTIEFRKQMNIIEKFLRPTDTNSVTVTANRPASSIGENKFKLPKLDIETFNGDYTKWQTFWDNFSCAIDSNESLSNVQKMTYLKNLLKNDAADIIAGLPLTNDNYTTAIKLMKNRYGNKQLLISAHMKKLLKIENDDIRAIYDHVESQMRSLETLDISPEMYGPLLIPILMSKTPPEVNLIISRQFSDTDQTWDIKVVMKILHNEISAREKAVMVTEKSDVNVPISGLSLFQNHQKGSQSQRQKPRPLQCLFCSKNHKSHECRTIVDYDSRKNIVIQKKRCFICLRTGHMAAQCKSNMNCFTCSGHHHAAMCPKTLLKSQDGVTAANGPKLTSVATSESRNVLLQTASVQLYNPDDQNRIAHGRALFDSCSQLSYITPNLRNKLKLNCIANKSISIQVFGNQGSSESLEQVRVSIKTIDNGYIRINCFVKDICAPISNQSIDRAVTEHPHLKSLQLADLNPTNANLPVDLLIGADHYWDIVENNIITSSNGPTAIKSKVGYLLNGPTSQSPALQSVFLSHTLKVQASFTDPLDDLKNDLETVWPLSEPEIDFDPEKFINEKITFDTEKNHYETELPIKEHAPLNDNYAHCLTRFRNLKNRLSNNHELFNNYNDILSQQHSTGVFESVPDEQVTDTCHYLPHRPVIKEDRVTTKIRIVYDASSKTHGPSLNECLHPGPSLTEPLLAMLLRFRCNPIAFIADIEKAFLNIDIHPDFRDYLRFMWFKDFENLSPSDIPESTIQSYRFCRLPFGLTCSPFILNAILHKHCDLLPNSETAELLKRSLHVDDVSSGGQDESSVYELFTTFKQHLATGSFNLRKFESNSSALELLINGDVSKSITKVLGVQWNKETDKLNIDLSKLISSAKLTPTRRQLLQFIASIYDPLGLINPVVLPLKCLFQSVCSANVSWDEVISGELLNVWRSLLSDFEKCCFVEVDRYYFGSLPPSFKIEVHGFADASKKGYSCCLYTRAVNSSGVCHVALISSKSRVAPVKKKTIPRLELQAALLLSIHIAMIVKHLSFSLPIHDVHCWSDSMIVLWWLINTSKVYEPFIEKRLQKIRKVEDVVWHHVSSDDNPADVGSRGCLLSELIHHKLWFGPAWLADSSTSFVPFSADSMSVESSFVVASIDSQVLKRAPPLVKDETKLQLYTDLHVLFNRVSKFKTLINVISYVLRFISNLKKKKEDRILQPFVTAEEYTNAELFCIKHVQEELASQKDFPSLSKNLDVFTDEDGIYRCRGRLHNAPLDYDTKFPILLPKNSRFTELLIIDCHAQVAHNGLAETLNQLRSRFWVPKARQAIKRIISRCRLCRIFDGKPFPYPAPPPLPTERVSDCFPFTFTGVDYAGPVFVKDIYGQSNEMYKAWIFLFTCASTRCIYLELVPDCAAPACIRALRRFFAARGVSSTIISDNGSQFTADETQTFISSKGIKWKFNLPATPWWGGMFERMVRSTKRCLKKLLYKDRVSYEELLTILSEIQLVINNRPLVKIDDDIDREVLTPNHLLFGRRLNNYAQKNIENVDVTSKLTYFWNIWLREYLTSLRETHIHKKDGQPQINEGDIVLLEENCGRALWKTAKVDEIIPSRDGKIRGVKVSYIRNDKLYSIKRPVNKLVPLETRHSEDFSKDPIPITFVNDSDVKPILNFS